MNSSTIISARPDFEKISQDRWIQFLDDFTRENRGAHARVEIIGANAEVGYQVETENRPFDGVSADIKDGESAVWITFGSTTEDHITHGILQATAIHASPATDKRGAMLEVEVFCLSWKWRERSAVKITERTHEEDADTLHTGRKGSDS
jgi:Family of unknown function (DUF5335)